MLGNRRFICMFDPDGPGGDSRVICAPARSWELFLQLYASWISNGIYKLLVYYKSFKVSLDSPSPVESQAVSIEVLICFIVHGSPPATWIFYAPTSLRTEFCVIRASPSDCPLLFWFPYSVANLIGDRRNKFRPTAIHIANIHIQRIWKQVSLSFILSS